MSRGGIAREKIQSHLGLDILKGVQGPGMILSVVVSWLSNRVLWRTTRR